APLPVPGLTGSVTHIAAGTMHSLVASSSGQLFAFGWNLWGQLGSTTNLVTNNANPTPTLVTLSGQSGSIAQLASGYAHSLVVTSTGQLFTFGYNQNGALGRAPTTSTCMNLGTCDTTPTVVAFPAGTGITLVATGSAAQHTLAVPAVTATVPSA